MPTTDVFTASMTTAHLSEAEIAGFISDFGNRPMDAIDRRWISGLMQSLAGRVAMRNAHRFDREPTWEDRAADQLAGAAMRALVYGTPTCRRCGGKGYVYSENEEAGDVDCPACPDEADTVNVRPADPFARWAGQGTCGV